MKSVYLRISVSVLVTLIITSFSSSSKAQTIFWSDNFNNGCTNDCLATTYGWTMVDNVGGTTGGAPNNWFVSCAEEGIVPPGCGSSCIGDASLHIGANPGAGGDMGASFNETGASNATYRLIVSPTISTVGKSTITLKFDYIAFGSAACSDDRAQLRLSTDNGATWPVGYQYCLTSVCCGACNGYSQGQWTTYTLALPAAFDNNPNVRIGFHWMNNGNGAGTDPSVAIDDVNLSTVVLPVTLVRFQAAKETNKIKLNWTTTLESQLNRYEVERSVGYASFSRIGAVTATGNNQAGQINYNYNDAELFTKPVYYRLKMVNNDGRSMYSNVARVGATTANEDIIIVSANAKDGKMQTAIWAGYNVNATISIYDLQGKKIATFADTRLITGENRLDLNLPKISSGYYTIKVETSNSSQRAPVKITKKFLYGK